MQRQWEDNGCALLIHGEDDNCEVNRSCLKQNRGEIRINENEKYFIALGTNSSN